MYDIVCMHFWKSFKTTTNQRVLKPDHNQWKLFLPPDHFVSPPDHNQRKTFITWPPQPTKEFYHLTTTKWWVLPPDHFVSPPDHNQMMIFHHLTITNLLCSRYRWFKLEFLEVVLLRFGFWIGNHLVGKTTSSSSSSTMRTVLPWLQVREVTPIVYAPRIPWLQLNLFNDNKRKVIHTRMSSG